MSDVIYYCPRDGSVLRPSRLFPYPEYARCPKCGCVIGIPDDKNPYDKGIILEPGRDFDPDPNRLAGMIRSALEKHGTGRNKGKNRGSRPKGTGRPRYMEGSTVVPNSS